MPPFKAPGGMNMKHGVRFLARIGSCIAIWSAFAASASADPVQVNWGQINFIGFGWNSTDTRVTLGGTVQNPHNCSFPDSYMVEASATYSQMLSSALLTAYSLRHSVRVVIDGCTSGRPKIVGVDIQPQ